jgi:dihydroorotase/N-acyl-D-amino-acid deacylase
MRRLALPLAALIVTALQAQTPTYDLLLTGGRIVDGTGTPWFRADLAITGDTIAAVSAPGRLPGTARRTIDVAGRVIAPGFIDIHTHARRGIDEVPTAANYARQGVTTVIEGPDGSSPLPIADFLRRIEALRTSVNFGTFVGQGSIRSAVVGDVDRAATAAELARMTGLVDQAMRDGALGLSTGLFYVPGTFTPTSEVIELAKVAANYGGIHESHQREETSRLLDSVRETIAIGEGGGLPTQISHAKVVGQPNFGRSEAMLRMVDDARARGVDVTIDQYPYTASSTSVASALLPAWVLEGTREQQLSRLSDPEHRARARSESAAMIRDQRGGGDPKNVQFASCGFDHSLDGLTLADLVARRRSARTLEDAADAVIWLVEQGGCQGIFHAMDEADLVRILKHPATMIASDGEVPVFGRANPHPRSYGTFVRVLGRYVREQHVLTLEDAVRKMTSFPAARLGLADRGVLRPGLKADIAVFDPDTVHDTATFERPHSYAEGVFLVLVNGQIIVQHNAMTAARPGTVLRRTVDPAVRR